MTIETSSPRTTPDRTDTGLSFVWLEITGKCQLECIHCYAESGPAGTHGVMDTADWGRVINECADLGVQMVQFIGGEPTLHPDLPDLVEHALARGLEVEVFSNLVHVSDHMWDTFTRPGVRLACSWYSEDPKQHLLVTKRNTHARTRANIAEALRREIPLRAGVIGMLDGQDVEAAVTELEALGVPEVRPDRLRQVGRGIRDREASLAELCGNCGDGVVAVSPTGEVWPCVFTRWMPVGNVQDDALSTIIAGDKMVQTAGELDKAFAHRSPCIPNMCDPECGPSCSPACKPLCGPKGGPCRPKGGCVPNYG